MAHIGVLEKFIHGSGVGLEMIGEKGAMVKRIGMSARRELEKMLEKKVHLELFVKVKAGWKDDKETYRLLGLDNV